ncbi:hypothetical protein [Kordiimonas sp.]|uniref:hypothetical protein n=1 Tax=Kordiimonas sp. TaxID=1970157 RepID=UPI003A8ECE58
MTTLSASIFVIGGLAFTAIALLLTPLVMRCLAARHQWQKVLLVHAVTALVVYIVWGGITWSSPFQVYLGTVTVILVMAAGIATDMMRVIRTKGAQLLPLNIIRAVCVVFLAAISAVFLGRTALELGLTNSSPVLKREITSLQFTIGFDGIDMPASVTHVAERTLDVWVHKHEFWPKISVRGTGRRFLFPRIEADLPFELYLATTRPLQQPVLPGGKLASTVSFAVSDIVLVKCAEEKDQCFAVRPVAKPYPESVKPTLSFAPAYERFTFSVKIPDELGLAADLSFTFQNFTLRPMGFGPLSSVNDSGNIWLLRAWDWFPKQVRNNCNNWGLVSEWRLCNITADTWETIEANKKKAARS